MFPDHKIHIYLEGSRPPATHHTLTLLMSAQQPLYKNNEPNNSWLLPQQIHVHIFCIRTYHLYIQLTIVYTTYNVHIHYVKETFLTLNTSLDTHSLFIVS